MNFKGGELSAEDFLQQESENLSKSPDSSESGLVFATVADYARAYRKGITTPSEVAKKVIYY
jgi:hypothetical protein